MQKILVVGGTSSNEIDQEALRAFYDYVQDTYKQAEYYLAYLDDLCYTIAPGIFEVYDTRNNMTLDDIDVVFIRGMVHMPNTKSYYLSRYCAWSKKKCINDHSQYFPADKIAQTILFADHGVSFLSTSYSPNNALLIKYAEESYNYPYILKAALGSHGNFNYLVKSRAEAEAIIAKEPTVDFLAQAFCPNDHDYRLLLVGDEQLLFERRGSADSHLNNTSKGADARKVPNVLPATIITQARNLAASLGLTIAGVDIMPHIDTGELYFLEVNTQPQLRTGAFVEDKQALLRKLLKQLLEQNG